MKYNCRDFRQFWFPFLLYFRHFPPFFKGFRFNNENGKQTIVLSSLDRFIGIRDSRQLDFRQFWFPFWKKCRHLNLNFSLNLWIFVWWELFWNFFTLFSPNFSPKVLRHNSYFRKTRFPEDFFFHLKLSLSYPNRKFFLVKRKTMQKLKLWLKGGHFFILKCDSLVQIDTLFSPRPSTRLMFCQ